MQELLTESSKGGGGLVMLLTGTCVGARVTTPAILFSGPSIVTFVAFSVSSGTG